MGIFNLLKQIMLMKNDDKMRIGLSQFNATKIDKTVSDSVSIKNKEVKLSDLMRRTNTY